MALYGIKFNGKHSINDFDLYVAESDVSPAKKREYRAQVPYMNGSYDFSKLFGESTFDRRDLEYKFNVVGDDPEDLGDLKMRVAEWLMVPQETELIDDTTPNFHFLAECTEVDEDDDYEYSELTAKFNADPFRYRNETMYNLLWDDIDFDHDYIIINEFTLTAGAETEISVYNNSIISIAPYITVTADITLVINGLSYSISECENATAAFTLSPGTNTIVVSGDYEEDQTLIIDWNEARL